MGEYEVAFKNLHEMLSESEKYSDYDIAEAFLKKEKLRRNIENAN